MRNESSIDRLNQSGKRSGPVPKIESIMIECLISFRTTYALSQYGICFPGTFETLNLQSFRSAHMAYIAGFDINLAALPLSMVLVLSHFHVDTS